METPIPRKWQRTIALARGYLSDDSPKRADWQFPDPILAGFFSLLLRLPANAICVAVFYRVTMPNVQCRFLRSIKKQKRQGRWRGKLSRLPSARSTAIPPFDVATFEKVAHLLLSHWPPGFYSARLHVHSILEKEWNRGALVNGRDTEVLPCSRKSKRERDSSESRASTRA